MTRLFADENITPRIVRGLRELGINVLTMTDARLDNRKTSDPEVLAYATGVGRAVIAFDPGDYKKLHQQSSTHAGIILLKQNMPIPMLIDKVATLALSPIDLAGELHRVVQP
jgi:predicted nuclease of predicted toxin-antitoxin system